MKVSKTKGTFLAFCLAAGLSLIGAPVNAAVLEMPNEASKASAVEQVVSQTEETQTLPAQQVEADTLASQTVQSFDAQKSMIYEGITIGPVDVSGMNAAQAKEAVQQFVDSEKSFLMNLDIGETQISATTGDVGIYWDNTQVVDQAVSFGKQGNAVQRFKVRKQLEKGSYTFDLKYGIADDTAKRFLEEKCVPVCDKKPQEPTLQLSGSNLSVTPGQNGCTLNVDASVEAIRSYLCDTWDGGAGNIPLVYEVTQPKHTTEELSSIKDILGKADTDYSKSSKARSTNITTAAKLINGTVLYPGETFSTLDTITPFSEENGYALAGSYANGTTTETFGGGICQVSTTLYIAALRAELEITERRNHSMLVTYVKPSLDAAIAESSGKDFKFKNNTDNPIYIAMVAYNGTLVARIWGSEYRPSNRKVEYESVVLSVEDATTNIKTSSAYNVGIINHTNSAHRGCSAELYKIVKEDGKEVSRERVNRSTYAKSDGLIEVGIKGASSAAVSALSQAAATNDLATVKKALASVGR